MRDHSDLLAMNERSLAQQAAVRRATFSPGEIKTLRPFSIWEISQFMFNVPADTLRKKLAEATGGDSYIETVWGRGYVLRDPEDLATSAPAA